MRAPITRAIALAIATAGAASCAFVDSTTGIKPPSGPAHFAIRASVATVATPSQIFIAAIYPRNGFDINSDKDPTDNDLGVLATQTIDVDTPGDKTVSMSVNLAACMSDPTVQRQGATCPVIIFAALVPGQHTFGSDLEHIRPIIDSLAISQAQYGPTNASAGASISTTEPMKLPQVDHIVIQATQPFRTSQPQAGVQITAFDATGQPIDNTNFTVTSSNPGVVKPLDNRGSLQVVGVGTAVVTASAGGKTASTTVTVSGNFFLAFNRAGSGSGNVQQNPSPTPTGYAPGTVVTLTANPQVGSVFAGYSGDCVTTLTTCTVTMTSDKRVTATFNSTGGAGTTVTGNIQTGYATTRTDSCAFAATLSLTATATLGTTGNTVTGTVHLNGQYSETSGKCPSFVTNFPFDQSFPVNGTVSPSSITWSGSLNGNTVLVSFNGTLTNNVLQGTLTYKDTRQGYTGGGSVPFTLK